MRIGESETQKDGKPIQAAYHCGKRSFILTGDPLGNCEIAPQTRGFPGGASGEELTCQCKRHKRHGLDPWAGKIPWRWAWQPTQVFLPEESHGQRSLLGYSP